MRPNKKSFINPNYPMSNHAMKRDKTWGGTTPRLRPGLWYPNRFLPLVLPERPGYVGTTKVDDEIGRVDKIEASKATGSPAGESVTPPHTPQLVRLSSRFFHHSGNCRLDPGNGV